MQFSNWDIKKGKISRSDVPSNTEHCRARGRLVVTLLKVVDLGILSAGVVILYQFSNLVDILPKTSLILEL